MENNIKKIVVSMLLLVAPGVYASMLHAGEAEPTLAKTPSSHSLSTMQSRELHTQMSAESHGSAVSAVSTGHASVTDAVCADGHCVSRVQEHQLEPQHLSFTESDAKLHGVQLRRGASNSIFGVPSKADRVLGRSLEDTKIDEKSVEPKKGFFARVIDTVSSFQANRGAKKETISVLENQKQELLKSHNLEGQDLLTNVVRVKLFQDNVDDFISSHDEGAVFDFKESQPWKDYISYIMSSKNELNRIQSGQNLTDKEMQSLSNKQLQTYAEELADDDIQAYEALEDQINTLKRA